MYVSVTTEGSRFGEESVGLCSQKELFCTGKDLYVCHMGCAECMPLSGIAPY